jgi:hypothetical protein
VIFILLFDEISSFNCLSNSPKPPPHLHQQPVQFIAHFFGKDADGCKLFLQILQIVDFGVFADLNEAGILYHFFAFSRG